MKTSHEILGQITTPVALVVGVVAASSWYVTWSTSDITMSLMAIPQSQLNWLSVAVFFGLMTAMMVAMMLPAALPMIVVFHEMSKLEQGRPTRPADKPSTSIFISAYFVVWAVFGVLTLLGIMKVSAVGLSGGAVTLIPAGMLLLAGAYQFTRVKDVCVGYCQSPLFFMIAHWRPGLLGALQTGLWHAFYCLGCCWLLMIALFIAGSMSLPWMGALSVMIFIEKLGVKKLFFPRVVGVLLILLGGLIAIHLLTL